MCLRLFPHAFYGANAFFDHDMHAICFGYFKASLTDPGPNIPGQTVFTCLAYDVIAHEMTHAVVHKLRRYFIEPSNVDVLAFHEGIADIVALFQRFSYQELLSDQIQKVRGDLREKNALVELAQQFGQATGHGRELRSALDVPADPTLYRTSTEPHQRGSILVSAVFDGFFTTYRHRTEDLIRIATGGTGILPEGNILPDLANRFAHEALRASQSTLGMCIRAFDYLPPVDICYGDYLRALVTADFELSPQDEYGTRAAMIEAFRSRGIYSEGAISLAEESLLWPVPDAKFPTLPMDLTHMQKVLMDAANSFSKANRPPPDSDSHSENTEGNQLDVDHQAALTLWKWANANRAALQLHPDFKVEVHSFHTVFRVSPSGQLLIELVAQFAQADRTNLDKNGGIPVRGGTTIVARADGTVKYIIAKPLPSKNLNKIQRARAELRVAGQAKYLAQSDGADPRMNTFTPAELANRMQRRGSFISLHMD